MNVQYFPGLRCYDSNLLAIIQLEQLEYLQLFSECFNFTVNDGSVIPICDYNIRNQMIESGALIKLLSLDSLDLSRENTGYIQLEMDIFDIPWHPKFLKEHNNHYVLLTNRAQGQLVVRDPMCVRGEQYISTDEMLKVMSIESIDVKKLSLPKLLKLPKVEFDGLKAWAYNVKQVDVFQLLSGVEKDSYNNNFYKSLWSVAHGISLYGQYYCDLVKGYSISNFENLTKQWLLLRSMLVNEYLRGTRNIETINKKIEEILEKEKRIIGDIEGE